MLTKLYPFLDPAHITPDLVRRLRHLADDAARLQHGRPVQPALLREAPRMDEFVIAQTPLGLQLVGRVSGHPRLGDTTAATSQLWFADPREMRQMMAAMAESVTGEDDDSSGGAT